MYPFVGYNAPFFVAHAPSGVTKSNYVGRNPSYSNSYQQHVGLINIISRDCNSKIDPIAIIAVIYNDMMPRGRQINMSQHAT